jgi:hypothetical protein
VRERERVMIGVNFLKKKFFFTPNLIPHCSMSAHVCASPYKYSSIHVSLSRSLSVGASRVCVFDERGIISHSHILLLAAL